MKNTCGTTVPYKFILNLGEWVTYKTNVRTDYLVADSGNTIKCEWWGGLESFSSLFDIKFSSFSFGYSEHCCELELYPKGMRPTDDMSARKPAEYTSVKNQQFAGKIFVLDNQVRLEVEDRILERGGVIRPTVVLKTDYLVINSRVTEDTAKRKRAAELLQKGKATLKIITVEEFFDMILKKSI